MAVQKWLWVAHDIKPEAVPLGLNGRIPGGQMNPHPVCIGGMPGGWLLYGWKTSISGKGLFLIIHHWLCGGMRKIVCNSRQTKWNIVIEKC